MAGDRGTQAVQEPHLAEKSDGPLPHGLCISNVGTDDFSEGFLHTLGGKERRQPDRAPSPPQPLSQVSLGRWLIQ